MLSNAFFRVYFMQSLHIRGVLKQCAIAGFLAAGRRSTVCHSL